jgi:formylglycine-generating enzyme required for sulfatase activity
MENLKWAHMRMSADGSANNEYEWPVKGHAVAPNSVLGLLRTKVNNRVAFDLPVEAQWEFACRAGTGTALHNGKEITRTSGTCPNVTEIARYKGNSGYVSGDPARDIDIDGGTAIVGTYAPNAWGIYDMSGNVMEYCLDYWKQDLTGVDPETGSLTQAGSRPRRGGNFTSEPSGVRSAYRIEYGQVTTADYQSGFRIAAIAEISE